MTDEGKKYDLIVNEFDNDRCKLLREEKYINYFITDLAKSAHILDIGCGMAEPIAGHLIKKGFKITGVDSSMEMLKLAKQRFPEMQWLYGDMRSIVLKEKFDGLIAFDSFFHLIINDQIKMLERFSNWLQPGGRLLLSTGPDESEVINAPMHGLPFSYYSMSVQNYRKYLALNQFDILMSEEDQPDHRIWIAQKINQ